MGAWGYGNFENDDALDWLDDFVESEDPIGVIAQAFQWLDRSTDYLEVDMCWEMLAACEVIAALKGAPAPELPESVQDWVQAHQFEEVQNLLPSALQAIVRVMGEHSELRDLRTDGGDGITDARFLAEIADLESRLKHNNDGV